MGEDKKIDESTKQESMFTIISQWISELVETETLPEEIVALNFGLYETPKGYCIYLNGSEEYVKRMRIGHAIMTTNRMRTVSWRCL